MKVYRILSREEQFNYLNKILKCVQFIYFLVNLKTYPSLISKISSMLKWVDTTQTVYTRFSPNKYHSTKYFRFITEDEKILQKMIHLYSRESKITKISMKHKKSVY